MGDGWRRAGQGPRPEARGRFSWSPARIILVYAAFSLAYIFLSDLAVEHFVQDPGTSMAISIVKGSIFVLVTALILFLLITRGQDSVRRSQMSLEETEARFSTASEERSAYHKRTTDLEQRIQGLLNRLEVGVFQLTVEGKVVDANPAFLRIIGARSMEDALNLDLFTSLLPEGSGRSIRDELHATGKIAESEVQVRTLEGIWVSCALSGGLVANDDGQEFIEGLIEDITDRKSAESELARMNETLEAVIEASPVAIMDVDQNKMVRTWNRAAEKTFGWQKEEVVGRPLHLGDQGRSGYLLLMESLVEGRRIVDQEAEMVRKDGAVLQVSLSSAPLHDAAGRQEGVVSVILDISERKEAEEEKRRAYSQIDRNIEQFAALVDSIRNPLTVIVGVADMSDSPHMRLVGDQAQRIEEIIKQLDAGWVESEKVRQLLRKGT